VSAKLFGIVFALMIVAAVWISYREQPRTGPAEGAPAGQAAEPAAKEAPPEPVAAIAPDGAAPAPTAPKNELVLPTGEVVRPLNGVTGRVDLGWPGDIPYSPIVRTHVDPDGREWYIHEDGSRSTTVMQYRKDLGREDPMSIVQNPTATVPNAPEAVGPRVPDAIKRQ
jgi:hypothetical protein